MNEQLMIYLWSISEKLGVAITLPIAITLIALCLIKSFIIDKEDWNSSRVPKYGFMYPTMIVIFSTFFAVAIQNIVPSKQDLALILLYPTAKTTVQSFSPEMDKFHEVLNLSLDNQIKELKSGKVSK